MAIATGTAILASAAVAAVGSVYAGSQASKASKKAAAAEAAAASAAGERLAPYSQAGINALAEQQALLGLGPEGSQEAAMAALRASPGYKERLATGAETVERSAAARGDLFSGRTGVGLTEYGQKYASNALSERLSRLGILTGHGQSAAAGEGAAGIEAGRAVSSGITGAAQGRIGAVAGVAGAVTGGIESALQQQRTNELMKMLQS